MAWVSFPSGHEGQLAPGLGDLVLSQKSVTDPNKNAHLAKRVSMSRPIGLSWF